MSVQSDLRGDDRPGLAPDWGKPAVILHRGAGRGTTAVAVMALLAGGAALIKPVGAPLLELIYPDHPVVQALNRDSQAIRNVDAGLTTANGRLVALTSRIETIEANLSASAERLGRLEARTSAEGLPSPTSADPAKGKVDLGDLSARLSAVEPMLAIAVKRIDALDTVGSNGKTFSARVDGIETQIGELNTSVTGLSGQQKANADQIAALPAKFEEAFGTVRTVDTLLEGLGRRLDATDATAAAVNGNQKTLRLSVALLQLNNLVQSHRPFARDVAVVAKLWQPGPAIQELEVLAATADNGVATVAELRDSFSVILAPKLRSAAGGGDRPMMERMRTWVGSWILPQNSTAAKASPVDLLVDATIERLAEEDIGGAIGHLASLDANLAPLTSRWIVEAKNRVAVDHAMDTLLSLSVAELARSPNNSSEGGVR